ncbi:hypothetical protein FJ934_02045 [Mesorhizobium sp. B2-4-12]|nr:hypothetical protein FJ934_02045 [Mesorhizobium sp. B2-4-12]
MKGWRQPDRDHVLRDHFLLRFTVQVRVAGGVVTGDKPLCHSPPVVVEGRAASLSSNSSRKPEILHNGAA